MSTKGKKVAVNEVALTEHTPDAPVYGKSAEEEAVERFKETLKQYAAGCEAEIDRIKRENAVKVGNTTIPEQFAQVAIIETLEKIRDKYLKLC